MLTVQNDAGVVLAYLNNLESAKIKEVINGEYTLSFVATIEPLKTEFLYDNQNLIEYNNDLFRVLQFEELHTQDNMLTVAVTAEHITYDLIKNTMPGFNYCSQSASFVMLKCLESTGFNFLGTDITDFSTDIKYKGICNSKQISMAIANNWQGELKYFKKDIQLLKQRGQNRGVDFRFGKNLSSIKRIRNFADNTVSYEIDVEQGSELEELGYFELGDTVRVIDDALGADYEVRIIEVEKDILIGLNATVVLGDEIKDLRSSFNGVDKAKKEIEEVKEKLDVNAPNWDKIKNITDNLGKVLASKLTGMIDTSNAGISNTAGTVTWTGNIIKIHDQPLENDSNWCMELGAFGWRIANVKNTDGTWRWRTVATGDGIIADKVVAGAIDGLVINGVKINGAEITTATLNGITINGATIYVGDRGNGNYIELSPNNPIKVIKNNTLVSSLGYSAIGGGNLTIFDRQGARAFGIECKEDGDLEIFCNTDNAMMPDPNHDGFWIPNPNRRKVVWKAGGVIFPYGALRSFDINGENTQAYCVKADVEDVIRNSTYYGSINSSIRNAISSHERQYHGWSDKRLKENIKYINPTEFMDFANNINLSSYNFINDETKREDIGVIAQDLLLHPIGQHFVHESDNGMYYVDYAKLATTALACSKHLYNEIESINARLERLERS